MSKVKTAVKHMMTEGDNETVDLFRVVFAVGIIFILCWGSYMMFHGKASLGDFANAFLQVFGIGAGGTGIKSRMEGWATPKPSLSPMTPPQMPPLPPMPGQMPGMPPKG